MRLRLALAVSAFGLLAALPAAADTVTLVPVADTYVRSTEASQNFGGLDYAYLELQSGPSISRIYERFDLSQIPAGATIQSAVLQEYLRTYSTDTATYWWTIDRASSTWDETTLTWDDQPGLGAEIQTQLNNRANIQPWDLTGTVQAWVDGTAPNDGVVIRTTESTGGQFLYGFWTREAASTANRPTLTVTYAAPPPTQVALGSITAVPSASGASISFTTNVAATGTVEYGTTASYGSSVSDAGNLTNHAIALTGLAASTTYHYRVRADATGGTTATSADATFTTTAAPPAVTYPPGVADGMLVKTADAAAVYYVGKDGKRHAFPNQKIYATWYADFSGVVTISATTMAALPLGANVTYRPGVRMVKFQTLANTYAVGRHGELRWIRSEALATALYGSSWNTKVDDLSDAFFVNYHYGADIATAADYSPATETASTTTIDDDL